jgi:hypothetical protein
MSQTAFSQTKFATLAATGNTLSVAVQVGTLEVDVFVEDAPTWGSGTLKLQASPDGTTWLDVPSASWTSGGGRLSASAPIVVVGAVAVRLALTGATSPSITPNLVMRRVDFRNVVQSSFTVDATGTSFYLMPLPDTIGVYIYGTFGGGTVKFQVSPDNGTTWYTVHSKSANDYTKVTQLREGLYRFLLSGSTSPALTVAVA